MNWACERKGNPVRVPGSNKPNLSPNLSIIPVNLFSDSVVDELARKCVEGVLAPLATPLGSCEGVRRNANKTRLVAPAGEHC